MVPGDLVSGKYRLLRQLGAGGMGSVWAARNELTDRDFAIKFLLPALSQNKEALNRFFLEARACGQIKHQAVVDVYDMGQAEDGAPYLVMELLEGEGLDHRLARAGVVRPAEAASWIAFVARGLEEAHVRGLVHRDLKPGNIFFAIDDRGEISPKILDFGVSKATGPNAEDFVKTTTGAVLGSPAYMSPEQAMGDTDIDARSDVWSLGVILYECLTGTVPFDAANYNALMVAIITRPHTPLAEAAPGCPRELVDLVDGALQKDRARRVSTARELAERLEVVASSISQTAFPKAVSRSMPPGAPRGGVGATTVGAWSEARPRKGRGRSSLVWLGAMAAAAGASVAGAIAIAQLRPPQVAVAGRASAALTQSVSRMRMQLEAVQRDASAELSRRDKIEQSMAIAPSELPTTRPAATGKPAAAPSGAGPSSAGTTSPPPRRDKTKDPHGGVEGAGF